MMDIRIKSIPHKKQRYETLGDYFYDKKGKLQVRISELPDAVFEKMILIHELVELFICEQEGIEIKDIDAFDIKFEKERKKGKHSDDAEPGHDPRAPYRSQHIFAENVERLLCDRLGINFDYYSKKLNDFCNNQDKKNDNRKFGR